MHVISLTGQQWLSDQEELQVALLQVASPADATLLADQSRPAVLKTISDLISARGQLNHVIPGITPALIALPELALSFGDWGQVDELVKAQARPLIVIAGFGFTLGSTIRGWLNNNAGTQCQRSWPPESDPENDRRYNGGWVWIHRPGQGTSCITFLKRTAEQSREIHVPNLSFGTTTLCMELDDLIIVPVICSDFLSTAHGQRLIAGEIGQYLQGKNADARKVLVVGLLLQDKPHPLWRAAITDVARVNSAKINVCLVNSSHDFVTYDEPTDCWRDYSGVYIAQGRNPTKVHFLNARRFSNDLIDAAVLRSTDPVVVGGPLRWTFSQVQRHLWANPTTFGLEGDGALRASLFADEYDYEAVRLVKRATVATDSPPAAKTVLAMEAFGQVDAQFNNAASPNAQAVCEKTLLGECAGVGAGVSADQLSENLRELIIGLKVIGALKCCPTISWQTDSQSIGQLKLPAARLLIWANPGRASTVRSRINKWRLDVGLATPILVFHKSFGGSFPTPDVISDRRRDVSSAPEPTQRSAAEPQQNAMVGAADLDDFDICLDKANAAEMQAALQSAIDSAISQCGKP